MSASDLALISARVADFPGPPQPQPFPLQGSKRAQVPVITRLIPAGRPRLVEPLCGSAAVSIGARRAGLVGDVVLADANPSLIALWQEILQQPERLAEGYRDLWQAQFDATEFDDTDARGYFEQVRERHNSTLARTHGHAPRIGPGESADFLFLLYRIVKAALRYSKKGAMNQSADARRTGAKPTAVRERLLATSATLQGAEAACRDWLETLEATAEDDVAYLDPPFQGTSRIMDKRYLSGMSVDAVEQGIRHAVERDLSLLISYDARRGPSIYGRALDPSLNLLGVDLFTGFSAQGRLLGREHEAHETLYLSPALVDRLGGGDEVAARLASS